MNKIYVAGHRGLVGSSIVKMLIKQGINPDDIITRTSKELDLRDRDSVNWLFGTFNINQVYMAAAHVGGIVSNNTYPADFIYDNIMIQTNVISAAHQYKVDRLLMLGSTCVYPKHAMNPIKEEYLMTGHLEPTNEAYAVAKIAGIKMCDAYNRQYATDFRSVLPCNLYGPGDNYDLDNGHVTAGILRKMHEAKINNSPTVTIWGTGNARREFLYAEDMAEACITVMNADKEDYDNLVKPMQNYINLSAGFDITIKELVSKIKDVVGYTGDIIYDHNKPDGTMQKLTDNTKILQLGWKPKTPIEQGLVATYDAYRSIL
jgi:GDP-L-fucose synthase